MVDLRPLTLGEIIDRSASFWRANWKALFKLFLGFQLGQFVVLKAWELLVRRYLPLGRGGSATIDALQTQPDEALRQLSWTALALGMVMLIYLLVSFFAGIAGSHYAWPLMLGKPSTLGAAVRRAVARSGTLLAFFGLMLGWTLIVFLGLMIPAATVFSAALAMDKGPASVGVFVLAGLLASGGMLVAFLWFLLRFLLASQVMALEDVGAWGVFRRCDALASGRIGEGFLGLVKVRLTVLFTVVTLIISIVSVLFGLPALIIQGIWGNVLDPQHATPDAIPQLLMVPAQLLQVVAQSVVGPLFIVFAVVFYADMRVRREGLDLELKMNEVKA